MERDIRAEKSDVIKERVKAAREMQKKRYGSEKLNANISVQDIDQYISLGKKEKEILEQSAQRLNFSPRVFHKIIKIARTIADLEKNDTIESRHILEALQYRPKEII